MKSKKLWFYNKSWGQENLAPKILQKRVEHIEKSVIIKVPLPNEKGRCYMLTHDFTTVILDLKDVTIKKVEKNENELHIHLELPRRKHKCPKCGEWTDRIHDYRTQKIKDIPLGKTTYLFLRKRRYVCRNCGKRFIENNSFLPRYYRITNRAVSAIINAFHRLQPATEIAQEFNISAATARRYFDCVQYKCRKLPEVLSIDEFKGNTDREKFQTILTDPEHKKVIDIRPNRFENQLIKYFKTFPNRDNVKYFITDMNPHFRAVGKACFHNAVIVADHYHVIRQAVWAMENVRKREQKRLSSKFSTYFKKSRYLLNKPIHKMTDEEKNSLSLMLEMSPDLAQAYRLKKEFLQIMYCGSSNKGRALLSDWILSAENSGLEEFQSCTTAYHNWAQEILNSLDVPWSNGFTEGCNNKIKVLKRVCFGFHKFSRFRNRILHVFS